jgi:hypothetical protein
MNGVPYKECNIRGSSLCLEGYLVVPDVFHNTDSEMVLDSQIDYCTMQGHREY